MSTIVCLKDADTLIFGTESRVVSHGFGSVLSDSETKIFEIAPNTFISAAGRKTAYDFDLMRSRELAIELGTTDIQAIGAALERDSLPVLAGLVSRLRLESDPTTKAAVSGEALLHSSVLAGRNAGGQLGYVARSYQVQADGTIGCVTESYFEQGRKITVASGAPMPVLVGVLTQLSQDMATWTDEPERVVTRLLEAMKQASPTSGGPNQVLRLDNNGAHWISRPPQAATPLVGDLTAANLVALSSISSPAISGGSFVGATFSLTLNGIVVTINNGYDSDFGFYAGLVLSWVSGSNTYKYAITNDGFKGLVKVTSTGALVYRSHMGYGEMGVAIAAGDSALMTMLFGAGRVYLTGAGAGVWVNGVQKVS